MKMPKYYVYLEQDETGIVLQSLNRLRNQMIREDKDSSDVDALFLKVMRAR